MKRIQEAFKKGYSESFGGNETPETDSLSADESYSADSKNEITDLADITTTHNFTHTQKESEEVESLRNSIAAFFVLSSAIVAAGIYILLNHERRLFVDVSSPTLPTRQEEIEVTGQSDATICFILLLATILMAQHFLFRRYDQMLHARHVKLLKITTRSQALVTSLFPEDVYKRLLIEVDKHPNSIVRNTSTSNKPSSRATRMRAFLEEGGEKQKRHGSAQGTKPIADFFPEATIMVSLFHCQCDSLSY